MWGDSLRILLKKFIRIIPCFFTIVLVLIASVVPASAATFTGEWTLNDNVATPSWLTVSISFESNGTSYTGMTYETYNEAYMVPVIKYGSNVAVYWRDGQTFFMRPEYRYLNFTGFQLDMNDVFSNWMLSSARKGRITADSEQAGQIKDNVDDAAGRLEDANDIWDQLPEPTLSGDEFGFLLGERPEYKSFMSGWQVLWNNSTLAQMMMVLGGLLVTSFLIFAGK